MFFRQRGSKSESIIKSTYNKGDLYSQVGMSENVTPCEGTLEACPFCYIMNDFALLKVVFLCRRG